jgi:hypothetical protein
LRSAKAERRSLARARTSAWVGARRREERVSWRGETSTDGRPFLKKGEGPRPGVSCGRRPASRLTRRRPIDGAEGPVRRSANGEAQPTFGGTKHRRPPSRALMRRRDPSTPRMTERPERRRPRVLPLFRRRCAE